MIRKNIFLMESVAQKDFLRFKVRLREHVLGFEELNQHVLVSKDLREHVF